MVRGKVIPSGWSAHHRPVANSTMTMYVRIYAPDGQTYSEEDRMNVPNIGAVRWEGLARIQQHNFESTYRVGEQEIKSRAYLVAVDAEVNNVQINDVVRAEAINDGTLSEMLVVSIEKGSERWQRDLICLDKQQLNIYQAATA